ncbi:MAG: proton-conducting transporter membrane subunit [Thermaerobacter sp.]|nr:proton-conducting transporter membrane subunit [Thermaerobacter sp.]
MTYIWLLLAAPWLAPLLAALPALRREGWRVYAAVAAAVLGLSIAAAVYSPALDALGRLLVPLVGVVGCLTMLASRGPLHGLEDERQQRFYLLWLTAFWWSLLLVALSRNLGVSWLGIELTTITSAVLVAISRQRAAVEAAWKYVILCSLGLLVALLGLLLIYGLNAHAGDATLSGLDFRALHAHARELVPGTVRVALIFLTVGLGTKVGFAPLHTWLPDAHSEAPAPVSGLLSGVLLSLALVVLWRTELALAPAAGPSFGNDLLLGFGFLTVVVATPFLLVQLDIKRLLAYSSMEQMGLIAIGLGVGSRLAVVGALGQIVIHALVKSGLFFVAGDILQTFRSKKLPRFPGLLASQPRLGWLWLLGMLTLAGLPPLPMFPTELAILLALFAKTALLGWLLLFALGAIFVGLAHYVIESTLGAQRPSRARFAPGRSWAGALLAFALALPLGWLLPTLLFQSFSLLATGR